MLKRLKNLWALGKYQPKETSEGISLTQENPTHPKGQATIVKMENPADQFPNEQEI